MMMEKKYSIGEFAKLTGITERTLRHYDQIGLLKPSEYTEHGHRKYDDSSIAELQKILVLKFLDVPLLEISEHLKLSQQDLSSTLDIQAKLLEEKRKQIDSVLEIIARVQRTATGQEAIDHDALLVLIHALKNEDARNRWLREHEAVSALNKIHASTVQLEADKEMTIWTSTMKRYIQEGKAPSDPEVLDHAEAMVSTMKPIVEPLLEDEEIRRQLEYYEGEFVEPNPYLFPSAFNKEEEKFMEQVIEALIQRKITRHQREQRNS